MSVVAMVQQSEADAIETCKKRVLALKRHVTAPNVQIGVQGTVHDVASIIAMYQESIAVRARLEALREQVRDAMAERDAIEARRQRLDVSLKAWATHYFGVTSQAFRDLGFVAPRHGGRRPIAVPCDDERRFP